MDYVIKAATAWFVGFFPFAEIYVAVPAALAAGLDNVSVIIWTVLGNFTPAVLITLFYHHLNRIERVRGWLTRFVSDKVRDRVNRYGSWFVLLMTPWAGIWVMAVTVKALGMENRRFLVSALVSILAYAVVLVILIQTGAAALNPA